MINNAHRPTLRCDNKSALRRAWEYRAVYGANHTMHSEYDVELKLQMVKESLATEFHYKHLKGHQDDAVAFECLPRDAQLNVEVDDGVRAFL